MNLLILLPIVAVEGLIVDPEFSSNDGGVSRWSQQRWYSRNDFGYDQLRLVSAGSRERRLGSASWQFQPRQSVHYGELLRWPRPDSTKSPLRVNGYYGENRLRRQWRSRRVSGDVHVGHQSARLPAENSVFEDYPVAEGPQTLLRSIQRTTMATPTIWDEQSTDRERFRRKVGRSQLYRR
ncbi:hypothetical protein Y032_0423g1204 [Ancylostoma ceylanicum]|uniref:Uncharacterized protein n=1 Tax=Ancylostoma ceylanicum TaxID=53326 RepID=A0A016X102_9BILA|nr:hypothetical protein Y032_0423g1204 [Ancylostoma ceylanicum]